MALIACGINHRTASVALRERVSISHEHLGSALSELKSLSAVNEAVLVSTCNRTEIYADTADIQVLPAWLAAKGQLSLADLQPHWYSYHEGQAIKHLLRVASGLDSMIVGEPQIFGQIKQAYSAAYQAGSIGRRLARWFDSAFAMTKQVRHETALGESAVSVAYAAVQLAKQIFANLAHCHVLLIGAGDTIDLVATHLQAQAVAGMTIANRSVIKAIELGVKYGAHGIGLSEIPHYLPAADIVVTATASQLPLLGKGAIETAIKQRKQRPMLLLDLAVPRDIEAQVAQLSQVFLYNIDDLQAMAAHGRQERQAAAVQAEALIDVKVAQVQRELQLLEGARGIQAYRDHMLALMQQELALARTQLSQNQAPALVLEDFAHRLAQKFMHHPTVALRNAAAHGRLEVLALAQEIFTGL